MRSWKGWRAIEGGSSWCTPSRRRTAVVGHRRSGNSLEEVTLRSLDPQHQGWWHWEADWRNSWFSGRTVMLGRCSWCTSWWLHCRKGFLRDSTHRWALWRVAVLSLSLGRNIWGWFCWAEELCIPWFSSRKSSEVWCSRCSLGLWRRDDHLDIWLRSCSQSQLHPWSDWSPVRLMHSQEGRHIGGSWGWTIRPDSGRRCKLSLGRKVLLLCRSSHSLHPLLLSHPPLASSIGGWSGWEEQPRMRSWKGWRAIEGGSSWCTPSRRRTAVVGHRRSGNSLEEVTLRSLDPQHQGWWHWEADWRNSWFSGRTVMLGRCNQCISHRLQKVLIEDMLIFLILLILIHLLFFLLQLR